ncbi:SDR family oxidoreductase [Leptospira ellisii]|uniref:3-ketoacyl-ACP reductase n=1 Tax=Leptospira ellisii TaxID=2023197 RepID=A0A2N0B749_9LEPT|nr:SDR family oxidoreductase [Leptospira ellisii]MDV6237667.1 SDR family oxidoreductase [Leptospira ellisii]PJZ92343.1 3-ketoacyl-ACP reductase [Leptospira ellisii]PKA04321.1 3-ketoacyl-ACP reductase [Leptospira ellisii]
MKNVLITGGSGGLGRAIVASLIREGYAVTNLDLQEPKTAFPGERFLRTDLTKDDSITTTLENWRKIVSEEMQIPVSFVHCAGYGGPYHTITSVSEEEWDRIFSVNLRSAFRIVKEVLPEFRKRRFGRILMIASSLSLKGSANSVAYSASKHALVGFVRSLAHEWGEYGITVNALSPGYMETSMGIQEDQVDDHRKKIIDMTPSKKIASPEEVARVARFLLEVESDYINGSNWTVDGGITAI